MNCLIRLIPVFVFFLASAASHAVGKTVRIDTCNDGRRLATDVINAAIADVSAAGGGRVVLPRGVYLSHSIRLQSNVTLELCRDAVLKAAEPLADGGYDEAEPNAFSKFQDFGHSHWKNSLIWGIGLRNVAVVGAGRIDGSALTRGIGRRGLREANKAIALRECTGVLLDGFEMLRCGHFALLATGVDSLTIRNLTIDTNRDGLDIDCCRDVVVADCRVNTPWDDAIVLKASYALGRFADCERVTVERCSVSGYDCGTLLDGTLRLDGPTAPDRGGRTGRIKLGTESSGGYRDITIRDCRFEWCRGLALETVDGGVLENVLVENISMHHIVNAAIFLRLGSRLRSPEGTPVGKLRNVVLRGIKARDVDSRYSSIIAGIPGHCIENVTLEDIELHYKGGCVYTDRPTSISQAPWERPGYREPQSPSERQQARRAADRWRSSERDTALVVNPSQPVPEVEAGYPEPWMFGVVPAKGFFMRHTRNVTFRNVRMTWADDDVRPEFVRDDCL